MEDRVIYRRHRNYRVVGSCDVCGRPVNASRVDRRTCGAVCRKKLSRDRRRALDVDRLAEEDLLARIAVE